MKKEYKITIVTPYHNVERKLFQNCCKSVQEQSYGFQKIQWIVVIHNSEAKYASIVHELLDFYENVTIKTLNNEARTPSSPRNYGLRFVKGEYLLFLDADDMLSEDCIERVLFHAEKSHAEVLSFRRAFELEKEGLRPIVDSTLWNQTQEEIIIDREHWEDEKMFEFSSLMMGAKLFSYPFLQEHQLMFDETIPFAEDHFFVMNCFFHAKKICYLPQLIGYKYVINSTSLVQNMDKPGTVLVAYAKGFKKIYDTVLGHGIYADPIISDLNMLLSIYLMHSTNVSMEERGRIKEILGSYVTLPARLAPNKLRSESQAAAMYELPREVILHPENFENGYFMKSMQSGQDKLLKILQDNTQTDYGERYHFNNIQTIEGYQYRVPLSSYKDYKSLIQLQTQVGETGIFVNEPIAGYWLSGRTDGENRMLPVTKAQQEQFCQMFFELLGERKTFLLAESLPIGKRFNDDTYLNTLTGATLSAFYMKVQNSFLDLSDYLTSPVELFFPKAAMDTSYYRILFALADDTVEQILAPFTWGVYEMFLQIERNWKSFCDDIETGTIRNNGEIPEKYGQKLKQQFLPNPERAAKLREIFEEGFQKPVASRIWPKLKRIVAGGSGTFSIYTKRLERYCKDIPHQNGYYLCSEGMIGKAVENKDEYELITDQNFYEFIPVGISSRRPLLMSEIEEGEEYELVLTSPSGLYRYRMGDILKITSIDKTRICFRPEGQSDEVLSVGDVRMEEATVYQAIEAIEEKEEFVYDDFAFGLNETGNGLEIFLEKTEFADSRVLLDKKKLEENLDRELCKNESYARARAAKQLICCRIIFNQPQTHFLFRDKERFQKKTAPDQIKPVHFIDTIEKADFFRKMAE